MPDATSRLENGQNEEQDGKIVISFAPGDFGNPYNWTRAKKLWIVFVGTLTVLNSTVASSLPSGASNELRDHFHVDDPLQLVLPNSVFLVGYVLGPFVFAPLSEFYGRKHIILGTYTVFTVFMLATALAPNWAAFNVFRFFAGLFGGFFFGLTRALDPRADKRNHFVASTPISNTGGLYADVYGNPMYRGRAMAWYLAVASAGPSLGPIPSGYLAEKYGWRWVFWFGFILAGSCLIPLLFLPETFAPAILRSRAKKMRREDPECKMFASAELQTMTARQFATKILGRPIRMLVAEPIVTASCLYLSLIYAVIFMFFQAYSVIFPPIYGFTEGETGLAFLPIAVGSFLAVPFCIYWDYVLRSAKNKDKPWAYKDEFQRLPLALVGGPLFTAGMFWIGWATRDNYWVCLMGGLPLGFGFVLVFVALFNYLVDSYKVYSASALGATSISRSTFGVLLPFAAKDMFESLGVPWACSLLGFVSLILCLIPIIFIRYGERLKEKSPMCQELAREAAK